MSAEVTGRCAGHSPASPAAVVLGCLGAVGRKCFWWDGKEEARAVSRALARPVPQREGSGCPQGRPLLLQLRQSFSTTSKWLFQHFKAAVEPVSSRYPWALGTWVKAAFDYVTDTQVLPQHRYLQCLPVLLQVLYFVQPPLCPVPSLGQPGTS